MIFCRWYHRVSFSSGEVQIHHYCQKLFTKYDQITHHSLTGVWCPSYLGPLNYNKRCQIGLLAKR